MERGERLEPARDEELKGDRAHAERVQVRVVEREAEVEQSRLSIEEPACNERVDRSDVRGQIGRVEEDNVASAGVVAALDEEQLLAFLVLVVELVHGAERGLGLVVLGERRGAKVDDGAEPLGDRARACADAQLANTDGTHTPQHVEHGRLLVRGVLGRAAREIVLKDAGKHEVLDVVPKLHLVDQIVKSNARVAEETVLTEHEPLTQMRRELIREERRAGVVDDNDHNNEVQHKDAVARECVLLRRQKLHERLLRELFLS
eukprot:Amastigsp_a175236_60.p2 type:complete len:261 gc:universal Amastigsp_a175236_60:846-64(-)